MHLIDLSPEAAAYRGAVTAASNDFHSLSLEAGALAGLLELISCSGHLEEQHQMALGKLADMAQRLEDEIEAVAARLDEAGEAD